MLRRDKQSWPKSTSRWHLECREEDYDPATCPLKAPRDDRTSTDLTEPLSKSSQAASRRVGFSGHPTPQRASYHRRQNSIHFIDTYIPARRDSFSQTQCEARWRSEVVSYGGPGKHASRRSLTLEPILEPEAAVQATWLSDVQICECGRPAYVR